MMHTPARTHEMSLERARMAARQAAEAHLHSLNEAEKANAPGGGLAVLTWGALAMACSLAAAVTVALPLMDSQWNNNTQLVETEETATKIDSEDGERALTEAELLAALEVPANDPATPELDQLAASAPQAMPPLRRNLEGKGGLDGTTVSSVPKTETLANRDSASLMQQVPANAALVTDALTVNIMLPKSRVAVDMQLNALRRRAPSLFGGKALEPSDTGATLTVGPFASPSEIAQFCRNVKLSLTLDCQAG